MSAHPQHPAHIIRSDAEAIEVATRLAARFAVDASARDRDRILPFAELEAFSASGLWGITIPKEYGGAGVSYVTVAEVIKLISAADPSLGQIPQNHLGVVDILLQTATEEQKRHYFGKVLAGYRFGNAFSEAKSKNAGTFDTQIRVHGDTAYINGEKFYCTGALFAHIVPTVGNNEHGQAFIAFVERDAPGLSVIDSWDGFGQRTTASGGVTLDGVTVPLTAVIPAHQAFDQPTANGPISQIIQAAVDTGIALGALEQAKIYARQARPWIDSQQEHGWQDPSPSPPSATWNGASTAPKPSSPKQVWRLIAPSPSPAKTPSPTPRWWLPRPKSSRLKPPCSPAANSSNWPARARSPANITLIASGATRAPTPCTTRPAGNTT